MANFVSLDIFRPEINQYCPGAPAILIRTHVLKAAIRFCERTNILKKSPSSFCLNEDQSLYTLKFSADRYRAVAIDEVRMGEGTGSRQLTETTENELDHSIANWRNHTGTKPHSFYLTENVNEIRFYPTPSADSDEEIFIKARVAPMRNQTELDEFLYETWEDGIQTGAIASLLLIINSSWFDSTQSAMFANAFKKQIRRARKTVLAGTGKYPSRVMPQSFIIQGGTKRRTSSWV